MLCAFVMMQDEHCATGVYMNQVSLKADQHHRGARNNHTQIRTTAKKVQCESPINFLQKVKILIGLLTS